MIKVINLLFVLIGYFTLIIPTSEKQISDKKNVIKLDTTDKGVAIKHCSSCHLFPEPNLLDQKTWLLGVLPNMAYRLGLSTVYNSPYSGLDQEEIELIKKTGVYPEEPLISKKDWDKIIRYYVTNAPIEPIPIEENQIFEKSLNLFEGQYISFKDAKIPKTTLLTIEPSSKNILVGDAASEIFVLNKEFEILNVIKTPSPPAWIDFPKNKFPRLLCLGSLIPSEKKEGKLLNLNKSMSVIIDDLPRSVHLIAGDVNSDGVDDTVICGFGNHTGRLFWIDGKNNQKQHTLSVQPGARKAAIRDLDLDGKLDIVVMMAQGNEKIIWFKNLGNEQFEEIILANFHPLFGLSNFEFIDFNNDGFHDLLISNGDNWDFSNTLKNFHGIRVLLNDSKNNFKENYFFALEGASSVKSADFDQDGDFDIVGTSFYSEIQNPEKGFVYLENQGTGKFKPYTTEVAKAGKWLCLEIADIDSDGDLDILLGSYFHTQKEVLQTQALGFETLPQILILKNLLK